MFSGRWVLTVVCSCYTLNAKGTSPLSTACCTIVVALARVQVHSITFNSVQVPSFAASTVAVGGLNTAFLDDGQ
jgi:hypothetical protein